MPGKSTFQELWLEDTKFSLWLRKGESKYSAFCYFCKKQFDVSHSGHYALTEHAKGKKHDLIERNLNSGKQVTISCFTSTRPKTSQGSSSSTGSAASVSTLVTRESSVPVSSLAVENPPNVSCNSAKRVEQSRITDHSVQDTVTEAEILWYCHCIMTHTSTRSGGKAVDLFSLMFRDSCIAKRMKLHKDKLAYSVTYGLGQHFKDLLVSAVKKSPFYALSVDESLNEIYDKDQMDIIINYWDVLNDCVATRYLTSVFLGKSTALDLLENITTCMADLNLPMDKIVQLATDGPNVNLKLAKDLNSYCKDVLEIENQILDLGSCSLHVVNGSYRTAHEKVKWKINRFLKALYKFFKHFPVRRTVYTELTGSSVFPLKFCSIRRTENSPVIRRCLEMLPHLKTYVKNIENPPDSENFSIVKNALLEDRTLEAKLHFSAMIAEELEVFLTIFQRNDPILPFLHQEVFKLMKSLGSKFIKKKTMRSVSTATELKEIDVNSDDNLQNFDTVEIGFGAESALNKVSRELDCQKFRSDCKKFLILMYKKLLEKSPLNKNAVLGATCLNPSVMRSEVLRESRVKVAIKQFEIHNQITSAEGDFIRREYLRFCDIPLVQEKLKAFNWKKGRLDTLFSELFKLEAVVEEHLDKRLFPFFMRILVCFHGNATVERSFSFNKDFLVENLQEKSLIAQRSLHDHIMSLPGGLPSLPITKQMIEDFRDSSSRRKEDLKVKKAAQDEASNALKRAIQEIKELNAKRKKVLSEKEEELSSIDSKLKALKKKL